MEIKKSDPTHKSAYSICFSDALRQTNTFSCYASEFSAFTNIFVETSDSLGTRIQGGPMPRKVYRRYDPRLKNLVANSKDISHFYKLGIPKSTLKKWKICGPLDYFSIPELDFNPTELLQEYVLLGSVKK